MATDEHGELREDHGRTTLQFERELAFAPKRVWRALTSIDELRHWHPTPFELDGSPPITGGRVAYAPPPHVPELADGRLLAYDPPRVLAYTWWDDELRWEIEERDGGCLLRLTHTFDDRFKAARDAAGWHLCLDVLMKTLVGAPRATEASNEPLLPEGWSELNDEYQRRFRIAPEQATPPPRL
jgi:uncharacterized protein YndB with AHSA1/START domain